jgi:hypothetical protein
VALDRGTVGRLVAGTQTTLVGIFLAVVGDALRIDGLLAAAVLLVLVGTAVVAVTAAGA